MDLPEELSKIVKGEVYTDAETLAKHSRDASVFTMTPRVVVCPWDAADISALVTFVNANPGLSLVARAAGTDMSGGSLTESICISLTEHLSRILEIGESFATVEPGVFYRDFEKATLEKGLIFPSFPASKNLCAIGGIINNNAGGEKSLSYGKTVKYVEEVMVILRDGKEYGFTKMREDGLKLKMAQQDLEGQIYREVYALLSTNYNLIQAHRPSVSKNSTGYQIWDVWTPGAQKTEEGRPSGIVENGVFDMTKLFVGSQGTLGIMTQAKIGLVPIKQSHQLMVISVDDFAQIPGVVQTVLSHQPTEFECFDQYTTKLAVQYFPDLLEIVKKHYTAEVHNYNAGNFFGEAEDAKLVLLVEFEEGSEAEVKTKVERLSDALKPLNLGVKIITEPVEREIWWAVRHESFNLLRQRVQGKYAAPFIDDLTVSPQFLPEFLPALYEILNKSKMTFTVAGHIGDGNFHIFPLMDMSKKEERDEIFSVGEECFALTVKYGGSISGEHNDGLVRAPFVEMQFGHEIYQIFSQIKQIFDPGGIFNPNKKIGITKEYSERYLLQKS